MKGVNHEGRDLKEKVIEKRLPFSAFSTKARPGQSLRTSGFQPDVEIGEVWRIDHARL
jgi:hypothetical protein